jgi:3-polyprenyl-4-hydroxybenzoate decarboxylase
VMPPVPAFYTRPETISDIVDDTVGRVLQRLGLPVPDLVEEWPGDVVRDDA